MEREMPMLPKSNHLPHDASSQVKSLGRHLLDLVQIFASMNRHGHVIEALHVIGKGVTCLRDKALVQKATRAGVLPTLQKEWVEVTAPRIRAALAKVHPTGQPPP